MEKEEIIAVLIEGFPNSQKLGEVAKQIVSSPRPDRREPRTKKLISPTEFLEEKKDDSLSLQQRNTARPI